MKKIIRIQNRWLPSTLCLFATVTTAALAEPEQKPAPKEEEKPEVKITDKEVKLPGVTIDRVAKEVKIDAIVCLTEGLLEFAVCQPGTFEHESIFTTTAKPEFVHAALLLCGLRPTPQRFGMGAGWGEMALKNKESRVKIEVEWLEEGKKKRLNLSEMLIEREEDIYDYEAPSPAEEKKEEKKEEKDPVVQDAWVFSGSFLHTDKKTGERFYAANASGILVGIWPDPTTVIQYGIETGDPYKGKHLGLEINTETVPAIETPVKLIFSAFKKDK